MDSTLNKDAETVFMYGHIDKQPPLTDKWREGLHPYKPVVEGERLYGRGGADDGYAFFSCTSIIKNLQKFKLDKHRIVLFFETDEESGSKDLVHFLKKSKDVIGSPKIAFCLDSGCGDYERFFLTTTLRGCFFFSLKVSVSSEGVHSGVYSGVFPDSFRVARSILDQFEDSKTGNVIPEFFVNVPKDKYA